MKLNKTYKTPNIKNTQKQFQESKTKYQHVSTQLIDKAGMLEMKKVVDFDSHLERIRQGC